MHNKEQQNDRITFLKGMRDGEPIPLGYNAVAFTLGITAGKAGMNALQSSLMSALMLASAGEFAAISMIGSGAGVMEMIVTTVVINMRYLLMSSALSQKVQQNRPFLHRIFMSYAVTDEIFGISMTVPGKLNPFYQYGAASVAAPGWVLGTFLGTMVGMILPAPVMSAMSVAIYGMFLAVVIPPARKNKIIAAVVVISMSVSLLFQSIPGLKNISSGFQIILLTVLISAAAAILFPVQEEQHAS